MGPQCSRMFEATSHGGKPDAGKELEDERLPGAAATGAAAAAAAAAARDDSPVHWTESPVAPATARSPLSLLECSALPRQQVGATSALQVEDGKEEDLRSATASPHQGAGRERLDFSEAELEKTRAALAWLQESHRDNLVLIQQLKRDLQTARTAALGNGGPKTADSSEEPPAHPSVQAPLFAETPRGILRHSTASISDPSQPSATISHSNGPVRAKSFTAVEGKRQVAKSLTKCVSWRSDYKIADAAEFPLEDLLDGLEPTVSIVVGTSVTPEQAQVELLGEDEDSEDDYTGSEDLDESPPRGSTTMDRRERWEAQEGQVRFTIISDLDGTLLPKPHKEAGTVVHPSLRQGAAFSPLVALLNQGAAVIGVTGGRLSVQKERFWDDLPLSARKEGRVLLFCETGMVLYRGDPSTGEPVEDEAYGPFPGNEKRYLARSTVDGLVAGIRAGLRAWFTDLESAPGLLDEGHFLHALAARWSKEDAPLTHDNSQTPRIELRGSAPDKLVGMVIAGVPVAFGEKYFGTVMRTYAQEITGTPAGRLCYDCVVPGLSKHLVLNYLLRTGSVARHTTCCIGDSPSGNDEGLTQYHSDGIPFISVCSSLSKVPEHLRPCHVGCNEVGASAFLSQICAKDKLTADTVAAKAAQARCQLEPATDQDGSKLNR